MIKEITVEELDTTRFIEDQVNQIRSAVGNGTAINAFDYGGGLMVQRRNGATAQRSNGSTFYFPL